jgi:spore germination cell wall hydrolase CwlJ-like protein
MTPSDMYAFILLALCVWREARGELYITKTAVAWTVRNRVQKPGWWGSGWEGVILMPWQFSSFNANDPNAVKLPRSSDQTWSDSVDVAQKVFPENPLIPDPTYGATSYFDDSMAPDPPKWSYDGSHVKTVSYGRLNFYRLA